MATSSQGTTRKLPKKPKGRPLHLEDSDPHLHQDGQRDPLLVVGLRHYPWKQGQGTTMEYEQERLKLSIDDARELRASSSTSSDSRNYPGTKRLAEPDTRPNARWRPGTPAGVVGVIPLRTEGNLPKDDFHVEAVSSSWSASTTPHRVVLPNELGGFHQC